MLDTSEEVPNELELVEEADYHIRWTAQEMAQLVREPGMSVDMNGNRVVVRRSMSGRCDEE